MVCVQTQASTWTAGRLSDCRTTTLWRIRPGSFRVISIRNNNKVDALARQGRECVSKIVSDSIFHDASMCGMIDKLSRGIATSGLAIALCMALDTSPCEAAHAVLPNTEGDAPVSRPLASGPSESDWGRSGLYKKSYLMQALLQNSDGGIGSMVSNGSLVKESVRAGEERLVSSTGVMVEDGNSDIQQSATEKRKETLEDQNSIKMKIKWLNEITSQITEELNDTHPPPLKGQVEQARGKVSTELSAISGSMSNVASDLKEGFIGLKDTIKSIASQESEKEIASTSSVGDDDGSEKKSVAVVAAP